MVPYYPGYPDRTSLVNYLVAMIKTANEYDGIYATSDNREGILILTDTTHPYPGIAMFKMIWRMAKADISKDEMHVLCTSFWTAIYEPFVHKMTWKEIEEHCRVMCRFYDWTKALDMK